MMKIQELKELLRAFDQSNLKELTVEQRDTKLVFKKESMFFETIEEDNIIPQRSSSPVFMPKEKEMTATESGPNKEKKAINKTNNENTYTVESPMVGTFYAAPSPDDEPYVKKGDKVDQNSIVCIVEAMKLMNEVEAEVEGEIIDILAKNGELVEYGQPLFVIEVFE